MTADLSTAQHEAAHIVVGCALGLRLLRASAKGQEADEDGFAEWGPGAREAELLMFAAGVAWERRCGDLEVASWDLLMLRRMRVKGQARLVALERAAWAVLMSRGGLHGRVTRALIDGDLTGRDLSAMVRGETRDL